VPNLPFLNELSPNVIAALAGAAATLVAALINLRIAWRREVLDRLNRAKSSPRTRRGLLIAILILVVASGVGGYAGAMYLMQTDHQNTRAMRTELRQRIAEIKDTAVRLEQSRLDDRAAVEAKARVDEERRRGAEGVAATTRIGPCRARAAAGADAGADAAACTENDAVAVGVCVAIPAAATVYEVTPHARAEGDGAAWAERRLALGARAATVRFAAQPVERPESGSSKHLCVDAWSWDSQRTLDVRLLVKYLLPDGNETTGSAQGAPLRAAATRSP
jgi:hypothetical protein